MGKDKKILCNELIFDLMTNKIPIRKQENIWDKCIIFEGKY
jgi:hypothetical protein